MFVWLYKYERVRWFIVISELMNEWVRVEYFKVEIKEELIFLILRWLLDFYIEMLNR